MDGLSIHERREVTTARPASITKTDKTAAAPEPARVQPAVETPERLAAGTNAGEDRFRQSRLILQTGESVLTEVSGNLERMLELLKNGTGEMLSADLKRLGREIERLLDGASAGDVPLFQRGDTGVLSLPVWLQNGIALGGRELNTLLASLGLTGDVDAEQLFNAITGRSLDANDAVSYLSTLYLGAIIAGDGEIPEHLDKEAILDGLRQLLELVNEGMNADEAISKLSGGTFPSFASFEAQFSSGNAPDLLEFLSGCLHQEEAAVLPPLAGLLDGLTGVDEMEMELWMTLGSIQSLNGGGEAADGGQMDVSLDLTGNAAAVPADHAPVSADGADNAPLVTLQFGGLEVSGNDLSGVSFSNGVLTLNGEQNVIVRGSQPDTVILMNGPGSVTLENVRAAALTVDTSGSRVFIAGEQTLERIELRDGADLILDGKGILEVKQFQAARTSSLRLNGGTLLADSGVGTVPAKVEINGAAVLPAATEPVMRGGGKLESFDLIWKTLLPGMERLISASADGSQARLMLGSSSPARLWLDKGPDGSHGYPARLITLVGADGKGNRKTQSLFLRWDGGAGQFQEVPMYPNPFQVSGGVEGEDWAYDPAARTLRILTGKALTVSGGPGLDAGQNPFSGRVVLADGLGTVELTLDGTDCQVSFGRAFDLGRGNQVNLFLRGENYFQSGVSYAGLSLGDGTALLIDSAPDGGGTLTAYGGYGGAGIGRDRNAGTDGSCRVAIRGGSVTARAFGAGAGIGAGRDGAAGTISIGGGTVSASGGKSGGAAIGGAPGGPVGDITISGGVITVSAPSLPDPIGAGAGSSCGEVRIARGAQIVYKDGVHGMPEPKKTKGIPLALGNETIVLPRFRLSAEGLRIQNLDVSTPAGVRDAQRNVSEASRRVWRIQLAYSEMFSRLEEHLYSLWNVQSAFASPVRSAGAANALLSDVKQAIAEQPEQAVGSRQDSAAREIFRLLHKT